MASKTHQFDDSVVVDAPDFKALLDPALQWLRQATPQGQVLFAFSQAEVVERFRQAADRCGVGVLKPELYMLRHSGPTYDQAVKYRTLSEIKLRGRWMSDASVQRYRKEGRVAEQLHRLQSEARARALQAPAELRSLLGRPSSASFPPFAEGRHGRRSF